MPTKKNSSPSSGNRKAKIKSVKLRGDRRKALALLIRWSEEARAVLLEQGGIGCLGRIARFPNDTQNLGYFMSKTSFGVHAEIILVSCEKVAVGGLSGRTPHITLSNPRSGEPQKILSIVEGARPDPADIQRVLDQFRAWIKMQSALQVAVGDSMRMTFNKCSIAELAGDFVVFVDEAAAIAHIISVKDSSSVEMSREDDETSVILTNRDANSFVTIRDGVENPEAVFARFSAFTRTVH